MEYASEAARAIQQIGRINRILHKRSGRGTHLCLLLGEVQTDQGMGGFREHDVPGR